MEISEDVDSLDIFREILREEYGFKSTDKCRFFNSEGSEVTEETFILTKHNDTLYIEPSSEKSFDLANIFRQFKVLEKLGQGGFGKVYKALNVVTQQTVAIKYIDITEYSNFP